MNEPQNNNRTLEDKLAHFTDQILEESKNPEKIQFTPDSEQRTLEQTVLRLKNAFPEDGPSEAVIQRMRNNILFQWKQQESKASEPYWKRFLSTITLPKQRWQSQRSIQRWHLAVSLITVAVLALISIPLLNKISSNQTAASGQNLNAGVFAATGALVLLAVWLLRRKP